MSESSSKYSILERSKVLYKRDFKSNLPNFCLSTVSVNNEISFSEELIA